MSLGLDIMEAVRLGGSNNWMPCCEKNQKEKSKKSGKNPVFEKLLTDLKESMKDGRWTISELSKETGESPEALRHRLDKLMKRGEVKRGTKAPFVYWVLNT